VDFVEIYNIYIGKMIIKAAKRIFNSDTICRSYSGLNFGVTFFGTQCSICNFISLFIIWVRSFSKMLPYIKFAEANVLVFVILRKKCENSATLNLTLILTLICIAD